MLALVATTALVAACGGGGGGDDPVAPPPPPPPSPPGGGSPATPTSFDQVQGFWSGPIEGNGTVEAMILRNGETWVVVQSGGAVRSAGRAQGVLGAAGMTATGVLTDLAAGTSQTLTVQATAVVPKASLTGSLTAPPPVRSVTWAYNARYDTTLPLADFAGRWSSTAGGQRIAATWDITAAGAVTGTSSTGCTYTGTLAAHPQAASLASLALSENCAGRTLAYAGVANLNEARTQASFVLGNAAATEYSFVALQK